MTHDLLKKKCQSCEGGVPPLTREEAESYMAEVVGWEMSDDGKMISKKFQFKDFVKAMTFVEGVADVAEMEGHHPDIHISYNRVKLELYTHSIKGLSENDFIVAAKVDQIPLF
ncbi:MAG TPA: 4a-hydroxytetrahydrobiopterin dehydratase [Candidatus Paceibacterota bacterium]|nr:4a-hydroxytetrahydrobiopterin dehydratase [Candidatus Paceibacterota bacterium]